MIAVDGLGFVGFPSVVGPATAMGQDPPPLNTGEGVNTMSTFVQLGDPPSPLDDNWQRLTLGDVYTTPAALGGQLDAMRRELKARTTVENDVIKAFAEIAGLSALFPTVKNAAVDQRAIAYRPERARWISEVDEGIEGKLSFPDPPSYSEFRHRAARLYCAAKNASENQATAPSSRVMGKKNLIDFTFLGQHVGLMTVEPTLAIEKPQRFDSGGNDGVQGFVLPFLAGLRLTPVPFLPSLPELRAPVAVLTADSEVITPIDLGTRKRKWNTSTNVMAFASVGYGSELQTKDLTLFTVGPISVKANVGVNLGVTSCSEQAGYDHCRQNPTAQVGRLLHSTQTDIHAPFVAAAQPARGMRTGKSEYGWTNDDPSRPVLPGDFNDAPWTVNTGLWYANVFGKAPLSPFPTFLPDPLASRMLQNNDKSFNVVSNAGLSLGIKGEGGVRLPPDATDDKTWLYIGADVSARVQLSTSIVHRFREQEEVQAMHARIGGGGGGDVEEDVVTGSPLTAFTVTPGVQPEPLDFEFSGGGMVKLRLPVVGVIQKRFSIFKVPLQAGQPGPAEWWTERNRVRLTTMQSFQGQVSFDLVSHLPSTPPFKTYENAEACQAPNMARAPAPPRCGSVAPRIPNPPAAQLCFVTPTLEIGPDQQDDPALNCYLAMQPWLKSGTFKEQVFKGVPVVAHVLQVNNPADTNGMASAIQACGTAYQRAGQVAQAQNRFEYIVCDGSGQLFEDAASFSSNHQSGALPTHIAQPSCTP